MYFAGNSSSTVALTDTNTGSTNTTKRDFIPIPRRLVSVSRPQNRPYRRQDTPVVIFHNVSNLQEALKLVLRISCSNGMDALCMSSHGMILIDLVAWVVKIAAQQNIHLIMVMKLGNIRALWQTPLFIIKTDR